MSKTRKIVKNCPSCKTNVAVASKSCKCGHCFFNARSSSTKHKSNDVNERRRTSRVRREKPNYYDSQEFDRKKKKKDKRGRRKTLCPEIIEEKPQINKDTSGVRAKRRRLRKEEEDGIGDICSKLPDEKQELAAIILSEINRKLGSVLWSPS